MGITDLRQHDIGLKYKGECWKPDDETKPSLASLGYVFGETIGEGEASKVKKAYSKQHKKHVAIKIIQKRKLSTDVIRKFVWREISILQRTDHPGIVSIITTLK